MDQRPRFNGLGSPAHALKHVHSYAAQDSCFGTWFFAAVANDCSLLTLGSGREWPTMAPSNEPLVQAMRSQRLLPL